MKTAPTQACTSVQSWFRPVGMGHEMAQPRFRQMSPLFRWSARAAVLAAICLAWAFFAHAQNEAARKYAWKPLEFAILRFNDEAPNSWNIYHCEKKGLLLVRLWKRYLFIHSSKNSWKLRVIRVASLSACVVDIPPRTSSMVARKSANVG